MVSGRVGEEGVLLNVMPVYGDEKRCMMYDNTKRHTIRLFWVQEEKPVHNEYTTLECEFAN